MSSSQLADTEEEDVFDLTEAVPETERLDSSLQKARAQLSIKARRHRPSRSRLRDSLSSTEGDDSLDRKSHSSPLHSYSPLHHCSSPSLDPLLSSSPMRRDRAFTFDPCLQAGDGEVRGRCRQLLDASSQDTLLLTATSSLSRPSSRSETSSPAHRHHGDYTQLHQGDYTQLHQGDYSQSEDDSHDTGPDEPGSPTVLLDRKTKRRFLDLGVTLRRTYGKVRKDRTNRLSVGNQEPVETRSSSRSSGPPFVPLSWFRDRIRGSASSGSPKPPSQSPAKSHSQCSTLCDEFSLRSLQVSSRLTVESQTSHPYQSLSHSSEEGFDVSADPGPVKTQARDRHSAPEKELEVRENIERLNGTQNQRDKGDG